MRKNPEIVTVFPGAEKGGKPPLGGFPSFPPQFPPFQVQKARQCEARRKGGRCPNDGALDAALHWWCADHPLPRIVVSLAITAGSPMLPLPTGDVVGPGLPVYLARARRCHARSLYMTIAALCGYYRGVLLMPPSPMPMTAAIPKAPPPDVRRLLADLTARLARANEIAEAADAAGDAPKLRKAIERMALREEQIRYLTQRPADATCPRCDYGEEAWPHDFWSGPDPAWMCLAHSEVYIGNRVAERMADLYGEEVHA